MSQTHINAIMALLDAVPGLTVYDTEADDNPTFPYVVVAAPSLNRISDTLDDVPLDYHDYVKITGAGTGASQARWALEKAFGALDRKHPVVTGYVTEMHRTGTSTIAVDREVDLATSGHPVYGVDTYLYRATPA